jgi:glycosyltransferase involved in cell wall biosynthesis
LVTKKASTKVTVGLCLKNSGEIVQTALDSILKQDYPHEALKLVIVAEDESESELSFLTTFARNTDIETKVFSVHDRGLGASRQIVVDNAVGDYIVWVDDDFVLKNDFVSQHVEFMERDFQVGAARANETPVNTPTSFYLFEAYLRILAKFNSAVEPMNAFEIFRLKAIKHVGGYDVNIKGAAEDCDISIRLRNKGWRLSRNNSSEYYRKYPPTTWKALWRKQFWYGYGNHFLYHKYKSLALRLELFFPSAFLIGFRDSLKIYKINHEKKVFFLGLYYFFKNFANFMGFFYADLKGYGHLTTESVDVKKSG